MELSRTLREGVGGIRGAVRGRRQTGTGEVIARIAERYVVSEILVTTTLVNRGKLQRGYLERYAS